MKTTLRTQPGWNPFTFMSGLNGGQVHALNFYKEGKVIASCRWFGSNNVYKSITFDFEIKKAIKLNLNRNDAFFMKSKESTYTPEYDIYIHADMVGLKDLGRSKFVDSWHSTSTQHNFSVELTGERWHCQKAEPTPKNNFSEYERVAVAGVYTENFSCDHEFTDTPEAIRCKEIANALKAKGVNLSYFDVHNILGIYEMKKKV